MKVSIVIPVYRSSNTLSELCQRIIKTIESMNITFELICVDDGSGEVSWNVINDIAKKDHRVQGIQLVRNYGQHNATLCGIQNSLGDLIVTMDDDLQHAPEDLPKLIYEIERGFDVVYAAPISERQNFFRNFASLLTKIILQKTMGASNARNVSPFRIFKSDFRKKIEKYYDPNVNLDVLLSWNMSKFSTIRVEYHNREVGKSGYNIRKLVGHGLNMVIGFSTTPLRIASFFGLISALFGILIFVYVLINWFIHGSIVPGFTFLAAILGIFFGIQLLTLGIMGEYISRMYQKVMGKPAYAIRKIIKNG